MRFDKNKLHAAATAAIESDRKYREADQAKTEASHARAERAWLEAFGEQWRLAALKVGRKIKGGQPVTKEDLPQDPRWRQTATFDHPNRTNSVYQKPFELVTLLAVLDTIADDTVTAAALRDLGISPSTMRTIAQHLGAGAARA